MTQNRRIVLNIVATYGRSLYALALGLFTSRWALQALGQVDFGLYGVVGGLIAFVAFLNGLMAGAVGRFYAFSVGEAKRVDYASEGLENCRRWFNVAVLIHTVLPLILIVVGYPAGIWAIENYLTIPAEKIEACIWVWRFSCLACFVGMVNVPFQAMYTARQEIAELTVYGVVSSTLSAAFLYYIASHPGDWLVKYAAWTCAIGIAPQFLICIMAFIRFKECRIRRGYLWDSHRIKELMIYAGGRFVCALAQMFGGQGTTIAVNKILGPACNASISVSNSVVHQASTLTSSCMGAFYPAITTKAGSGNFDQMRELAFKACKVGTFAMMLFTLPLIVEIEYVMDIWLVNPPIDAAKLCMLALMAQLINHLTDGHWMSIFACGKVTLFNLFESIGFFIGFVVAVVFMLIGCGVVAAGYSMIVGFTYALVVKLYFGRKFCGLSARLWAKEIFAPCLMTSLFAFVAGFVVHYILDTSFIRLVVVVACMECVMLISLWRLILNFDERCWLKSKLVQVGLKFMR